MIKKIFKISGMHCVACSQNIEGELEDMGVKAWIDYVASETIQGMPPGTAIEEQFAFPEDYYRNDDDIARWEKRVLFREKRMAQGLVEVLGAIGTEEFEDKLDQHFDPHSGSCNWPKACAYKEICYGTNKAYLYNPLATGLYQVRTANHRGECEQIFG